MEKTVTDSGPEIVKVRPDAFNGEFTMGKILKRKCVDGFTGGISYLDWKVEVRFCKVTKGNGVIYAKILQIR